MNREAARRGLYARGRLHSGEMNRTETRYAQRLESLRREGVVQAFWFEAITLKIADGRCTYKPDFLVLLPDGTLELHEVKGSLAVWTDDSKVKVKACATQYPFRLVVVWPSRDGRWNEKEMP